MRSSTVASKQLKHQYRHLKINYVHIIYFFGQMSRRRGSSGDEARGRGGAHRGGGRLGQEHQDIDQVRPA